MKNFKSTSYFCHVCGNPMEYTDNHSRVFKYKGQNIYVDSIRAYICPLCGEVIYDSSEAKRIESIVTKSCIMK